MRKFVITSSKNNVQCVLTYNKEGILQAFEMLGEFNLEQLTWAQKRVPQKAEVLEHLKKQGVPISELLEDLSFETFWSKYSYKVKKARAEKIWNKMNDKDKLLAILGVFRYDRHLSKTGEAKAHPATYLQDKRWEDEY
jgi:hypothetical protein